jgi:hypothetical protein
MAQENKQSKVFNDEEDDEDDDAFVNEASKTLSWLWAFEKIPETITYEMLLQKSSKLWSNNKIWISDHAKALFEKHLGEMSSNDREKYALSHRLAKEFTFLYFMQRFMNIFEWKMNNISMNEMIDWENEAKVDADVERRNEADVDVEVTDKNKNE